MKENEAIKICNTIVFATSFSNPQGIPLNATKEELTEAMRMSIQALEKQIPKKPIRHAAWEDFKCPACGSTEIRPYDTEYREYDKDCEFEYCSDCGQKLDWSDND